MTRAVLLYLSDILDNMRRSQAFIGNLKYEEFNADTKTVYAVLRCLEVIGEAAKKVPGFVREKYPAVPWKDMAGMRDRLIHFYFGVSYGKVWATVKEDIPAIIPLIEQAVRGLEEK